MIPPPPVKDDLTNLFDFTMKTSLSFKLFSCHHNTCITLFFIYDCSFCLMRAFLCYPYFENKWLNNNCSTIRRVGHSIHRICACAALVGTARKKLQNFPLNPFHPHCKTICLKYYLQTFRFFANFQVHFSFFKTWAWLLCKIHILFYIKNSQSSTLKKYVY